MFKIITADQRMAAPRGVKALLVGPAGIGKTSQLRTLNPKTTLFVDLEAGDLSIQDVHVDTLRPRTWDECRDLAAFLGGPNPSLPETSCYSAKHYKRIADAIGDTLSLEKYETFFVDSITVAGRLCFQWSQQQPEAMSDKTGKPDIRGAYGLHAREMIAWLTQLQHARAVNVVFVGILEYVKDEFRVGSWDIQIEGAKTGRELPGIVDQIITMQLVNFGDETAEPVRAFICQQPNPERYPAKDRSGRLDTFEKPDLGELISKITRPAQ